jgi:pimeloyl-ACP methyl ester carboxylesterase
LISSFLVPLLAVAVVLLFAGGVFAAWQGRRIEDRHPPRGERLFFAGRVVHARDVGPQDAPPERTLVLIHGASGSLEDLMLAFEAALGDRYRIIGVDRPGHGWSSRLTLFGDARLAKQAEAVAGVLKLKGVDRAVVVGHSFGCAVALRVALDHPARVAGIATLAPVSHPWPGGVEWYYHLAATPVLGALFSRCVAPVVGAAVFETAVAGVFRPDAPPHAYAERTGARLALRPRTFRANAVDVAMLKPQILEQAARYSAIAAPALVVSGDADTVVWPSIHAEGLARDLPDVEILRLPGVGHAPHHARPAETHAALERLSDRVAARLLQHGNIPAQAAPSGERADAVALASS